MYSILVQRIRQAQRDSGLYFAALLSEQTITDSFAEASRTERASTVYRMPVVLWMFLSQILSSDHSCRETVARLNAWRVRRGKSPCSAATGRYCIARDQLNEAGCQRLVKNSARQIEDLAPEEWKWEGHRVRTVDGTTVTMPDTPANQKEYPQQAEQKPGCGQPIMRLVVLFSLATGVAVRVAMGPYQGKRTGENSLFRQHLSEELCPGDVLLADRCFSGWFDIVLLAQRGVEVVLRKHQFRPTDFRSGTRIGPDDHRITWPKPCRPAWMSWEQYETLPDQLELREIRIRVHKRGFRSKQILVVTTLLNPHQYAARSIAALYRRRWDAEINLRSLKTHLQMEHLRCKKPHRVRNEVRMHLLAYNLIRGTMATSAIEAGLTPWTISFKGTVQTLNQFLPTCFPDQRLETWVRQMLSAIATHIVGHRPDRVEPRVVKRRPKPYKLMMQPRWLLRKGLPTKGI